VVVRDGEVGVGVGIAVALVDRFLEVFEGQGSVSRLERVDTLVVVVEGRVLAGRKKSEGALSNTRHGVPRGRARQLDDCVTVGLGWGY